MVVTLLTDFGLEDEYAGVMKGVIHSINPASTLIDLCHQIPPGDIERAGWLLAWSWSYFPKGTVHVVVVDPGVGSARRILVVPHRGHLFLAPDNGVLTQVLARVRRIQAYSVQNRRYFLPNVSDTFHGRDIFAPVAAHLSSGLDPRRLGPRVSSLKRLPLHSAGHRRGEWVGQVIQWDRFGNAVTNLPGELLKRSKGSFEVRVQGYRIQGLQRSYSSATEGTPVAIIGSRGLLEIVVNRGSAIRDLGLSIGDRVKVVRSQ